MKNLACIEAANIFRFESHDPHGLAIARDSYSGS
jgi:hypothetical protein